MPAQCGPRLALGLATLTTGCACAMLACAGALAATGSVDGGARSKSHPAKHHRRKPEFADPLGTSAMRAYITSRTGDIAIGVKNLLTDRTYLWNGGSEQDTASIVKVDILETLLYQLRGGPIPGDDVRTAVGMIEDSDNDDATTLWNQDGGAPAIAAYDRLVGMEQTTPNAAWGLTTTTVGDQLKLLGELRETNRLIDQGAQRFALGLMENVTPSQAWGVSGGVPSGVSVALKNGWLPSGGGWQINSIGRIQGDKRRYLIAVLTSFSPSEAYGIDTISAISSLVWRGLAPRARRPHRRRAGRGNRIVAAARHDTRARVSRGSSARASPV
jgi:hypothetical protein